MKRTLIALLMLNAIGLQGADEWTTDIRTTDIREWDVINSLSTDTKPLIGILYDSGNHLSVIELAANGTSSQKWTFSLPPDIKGEISDFLITDMDNDRNPEIVTLQDITVGSYPWLTVFEWNGTSFSGTPSATLDSPVEKSRKPRPKNLYASVNSPNELLVLFGGSIRGIYPVRCPNNLSMLAVAPDKTYSSGFLSGVSLLNAAPVPSANTQDILFYSGTESNTDFIVTSRNSVEKGQVSSSASGVGGTLIAYSVASDKSGTGHFTFITSNGQLAEVKTTQSKGLFVKNLPVIGGIAKALTSVLRSDTLSIYAISGAKNSIFKLNYNPLSNTYTKGKTFGEIGPAGTLHPYIKIFNNLILIAVVNKGKVNFINYTLPAPLQDTSLDAEVSELKSLIDNRNDMVKTVTVADTIVLSPNVVIKDSQLPALELVDTSKTETMVNAVENPEPEPLAEPEIAAAIPDIRSLFDQVLHRGERFLETITLPRIDPGTFNMKWDAPEGASFNFQTGVIQWTVADDQLNERTIDLSLADKSNEEKYHWGIYVNDPPEITNEKRSFMLSLYEPFELKIDVEDENIDAHHYFTLNGLATGQIDTSGWVTWTPGDDDLDVNIFSIVVSDGFDTDSINFMIYVNDPVIFTSTAPTTFLPVNRPWYYSLKYSDKNEALLYQISFLSEDMLKPFLPVIEATLAKDVMGILTEASKKGFTNIRPFIQNIQQFENKLYITLTDTPDKLKISFGELLAGILGVDAMHLPQYTKPKQIRQVKYTGNTLPAGMTLSPEGLLIWTPSMTTLDSQRIVIKADDEFSETKQKVSVYVNAPPVIKSKSESNILLPGELMEYDCIAEDPNSDAAFRFRLSADSPPAELDEVTGHLKWKVKSDQYDYDQLTIIADDGFTTDEITLMIYVNDPVRIIPTTPVTALVNQPWSHQIKSMDRNQTTLYRLRLDDPAELKDIRRQIKEFLGRHIVTVSRSGATGGTTEIDVRNAVKHTFSFGRDLFIEKNADYRGDATLDEIFAGIINKPVPMIPKHKKNQDWKVQFTLVKGPAGMSITQKGLLQWTPESTQFDTFSVTVEASDGISTDRDSLTVFVNSPPRILSRPDSLILIEEKWDYPLMVKDHNKNQPIQARLAEAPAGMTIENFKLSWTPAEQQKGNNIVSVIVDDGYQKAAQTFIVFVNLPPVFTSIPLAVAMTGFDYEYQIEAGDPNGDSFYYESLEMPKLAKLNPKTGKITWDPKASNRGVHYFKIRAMDDHGQASVQEWQVEVFVDPSAKKFSLAIFPLMITLSGIIIMAALL